MSHRQNHKIQPLRKPHDREMKFLTVHSRSKQKSSSNDDKKSEGSLKKIFYKHEIFDKRNSPIKFKPLNQIKEEQSPPIIKKYKSSEQLNWKDKVIGVLQKEQGSRNEYSKGNQRQKLRSNSSKSGSKDNSQKNIQILEIENHQIHDERKQVDLEKQERNSRVVKSSGSLGKSSGELKAKQSLQQIPQKRNNKPTHQTSSSQPHIQITQIEHHAFNRDSQILEHKLLTNLKYLAAQTSQLLSYNKHMLLEQQLAQTKKHMSQLNIFIRRLRIDMRNHEYTKEINFTFPVQKHNDQILVKMPEEVGDKEMGRYHLMVKKLQSQGEIHKQQQQKIDQLDAYYQTLLKKYEPVLTNTKVNNQVDKLSGSKKSISDHQTNKIAKSKSSELISIKSSNINSSLASSNSRSPIKKVISQVKPLTPLKANQAQMNYSRYQTLVQKKYAIKQSLEDMKASVDVKITRLNEEINLLKRQLALIDSNIKSTDQTKALLTRQIELAKNKKDSKEQNIQKQYQMIANQRRANYQKQKQKRNIQTKGFTLFLRSNKSLSPVNYITSPSNKQISNNTPRNIKKQQLDRVNPQQMSRKKNLENFQSAKLVKVNNR